MYGRRGKNYATNDAIKTKFIEGEMKLKDQQQPGEEGYGVIDENDLVVLGHVLPKWTGSLTSNMTYKNLIFLSLFIRNKVVWWKVHLWLSLQIIKIVDVIN